MAKPWHIIGASIFVVLCGFTVQPAPGASDENRLQLLPYPQEVELSCGRLPLGPADCKTQGAPSKTQRIAMQSLHGYLPKTGKTMLVRLGSVEEGYDAGWLTGAQRAFLAKAETSPEASVLLIAPDGITIVGKGKWGMLYGAQTVNQLAIQAARENRGELPCLAIRDWPDAKWRCLSPQLAWYSGWAFRDAYDMGNWSLDEWKWLVDWFLLHKLNAWAVCMYGLWPFTLPGYEQDTMDYDSFRCDPATGRMVPYRYVHKNIKKEFLPELIRYANARGIHVDAYIGKNTYNGTYIQRRPEANAASLVAEAIPFTPGVHEYWDAFIGRILQLGFNGFVFEDPEMYHVPNQNAKCYKTFWEPWAKEYGFKSVAETNKDKPPLGVQVEYYTWLFRQFDALIQGHAKKLGRPEGKKGTVPICRNGPEGASHKWGLSPFSPELEIYLISHILLNRIMKECKSDQERAKWFSLVDEKHGKKVPFVLLEADEKEYVKFLGADRTATLGGRGGAGAAFHPIANINHNHVLNADVSSNVALERAKQRRMVEAGGLGGMAYVFQWTNAEVFGYIGAQHYWRHSGAPGINNEDDFGFLDYAYRLYYGDETGRLAAEAYSVNSCVNEWMAPDDGAKGDWAHGDALGRDVRLLAAMADQADELARKAYRRFTSQEPDLLHSAYNQDRFRWDRYETAADKLFKAERLRLLCVSTRRSRELNSAALSVRKAKQLAAEGASIGEAYGQFDAAAKAARASELLYLANYDDHYNHRGMVGTNARKRLEQVRDEFLADCRKAQPKIAMGRPVPEVVRKTVKRFCITDWEKQTDLVPVERRATKPGLYLSTDLGLSNPIDFFCVGAVFTLQMKDARNGKWRTLFRKALLKKDAGWQHWDIPLKEFTDDRGLARLRLTTDAYSRAIDRNAPTWKWGYWGRPQVVQVTADGKRNVRYDLIEHLNRSRALVQLDDTGTERAFDGKEADSSGATFKPAGSGDDIPQPVMPAIAAFAPHRGGKSGATVAEFEIASPATTPLGILLPAAPAMKMR